MRQLEAELTALIEELVLSGTCVCENTNRFDFDPDTAARQKQMQRQTQQRQRQCQQEVEVEVEVAVAVAVAVRANDCTMQMRNEETNFTTCLTAVCLSLRLSVCPPVCLSLCQPVSCCVATSVNLLSALLTSARGNARDACLSYPALPRPGWLSKSASTSPSGPNALLPARCQMQTRRLRQP